MIGEVLVMLNREFIKWVAVAFVFATPVAWYIMNNWLQTFAYKTELSWRIFFLAGSLVLGIALLTVSWQARGSSSGLRAQSTGKDVSVRCEERRGEWENG